MNPSFSRKLMDIRAQAGVLDADLIQVSVAEERYLETATSTIHRMSDAQLQEELERLKPLVGNAP